MFEYSNLWRISIVYLQIRSIAPTHNYMMAAFSRHLCWLCGYYLVRKNFSLAMPYLIEQGYSRGELGGCFGRSFHCLRSI